MSNTKQILGLVFFLFICLGAGGLGAMAMSPADDEWYRTLVKPSWNPPGWIFGPVWTTLYVFMAIAAWLVWRSRGLKGASIPLTLFVIQLILNIAWSWIFFRFHQPGWAFLELIVLWLAVAATAVVFYRNNKTAGILFLPYLAWSTFASVLNFTIWRLNA
ncbi:TspO/MBR family protein [Planctomicrobium sp. SH668]|uniref:TspO/MBR family protein n=1 Tax=Planctomicrobium sp. SH668 TaxID=3448126 RepID=UPI003F5B4D95